MALYDNIILEKGMHHGNKSFTSVLEQLDSSDNYKGTALEGLDSFERQLKRFDIKVAGNASDYVAKFFQTSSSAVLFPEYVKRCVLQGINDANVLNNIVAAKTKIDSLDYRSITCVGGEKERQLKKVAEGALIPTTEIKMQDKLIPLYKRGRMLVSSYEAIKFQRLDLFSVTLKQIGNYIARTQLKDAIETIKTLSGDNQNRIVNVKTAGTVSYEDLVNLWASFSDFEMTDMLVSSENMAKLLCIPEVKGSQNAMALHSSGKLITPFGATIHRTNQISNDAIIALDKKCALEMVVASDVAIESDKLIDRQLERCAITSIIGFARIFDEASKMLII